MDRRQQKSRQAILTAFGALLSEKTYHAITVQEIIDRANVGRSTFYAHFETKDELLQVLCGELFGHIVDSAMDCTHTHGMESDGKTPESVFCHLLQHLAENDHNILGLLSCENSELFLRCFKDSLNRLIREHFFRDGTAQGGELPEDFLVNHVSGSFVEMVLWWVKGGKREKPEQLDRYFRAVMEPVLGSGAFASGEQGGLKSG